MLTEIAIIFYGENLSQLVKYQIETNKKYKSSNWKKKKNETVNKNKMREI